MLCSLVVVVNFNSSTITATTCIKSNGQNSGGREALQSRGIGLLIRAGSLPKLPAG